MTESRKIQIIAAGITTLDECRYFAAMGVDWLGFNTTLINADVIKTLADWVVGPKLFVEMEEDQQELLFEISNKIQLDGVCLAYDSTRPIWYQSKLIRVVNFLTQKDILNRVNNETLLLRMSLFPHEENVIDQLRHITMNNECWIEVDITKITFQDVREKIPVHGVVMRCKNRTHDKAYLEYDAFFEEMEKLR